MTRIKLYNFARLIHAYLSSALFATFAMFCITGITLNHQWYGGESTDLTETRTLSPGTVAALTQDGPDGWQPAVDPLLKEITVGSRLGQPDTIDIDADHREIAVEYSIPSGYVTAIAYPDTAELLIEHSSRSTLAILNSLHKGRDAGIYWFWFIDIVSVAMLLFSITGFVIIFQHRTRRWKNLYFVAAGVFTPMMVYWLLVPSFG